MIKKSVQRILGARAAGVLSAGRSSLRRYPQYILGRGKAGVPEFVAFEVTYRCNARCLMCPFYGEHTDGHPESTAGGRQELTTEELKTLLSQCSALGVTTISLTGGEPFLRKDLCELVRHAGERNLTTTVVTNGSVLDDDLVDGILDSGLDHLNLSVDGPAEEHDHIRGVPGLLTRMEQNIRRLREAQERRNAAHPRLSINCTVSALNQAHLRDLMAVAARWKAHVTFSPVFYTTEEQERAMAAILPPDRPEPMSFRLTDSMLQVDPDVMSRELAAAADTGRETGVTVTHTLEGAKNIETWFTRPGNAPNNKCFHPWHSFRINPYGEVYPCFIQTSMGNTRAMPLAEIWNGRGFVAFRRKLRQAGLFPTCSKCCMLYQRDPVRRMLPRLNWF